MKRPTVRATLDYPFDAPACDGSVVEVAPGILWARMPMPLALDHINVYLLKDTNGWILVDTGLNTSDSKQLWEHIAATHLGGLPIQGLICTHMHYDHAGLAKWLCERFDIPLYMTHGEYFMLRALSHPEPDPLPSSQVRFFHRAGMPAEKVERMWQAMRKDPFTPPEPRSFVRLRENDRIKIGERYWEVKIGQGHSPEHACLYSSADQILIAGDQLLPGISSNVLVTAIEPEANPLELWLSSLVALKALAPNTLILPSHQRVFKGLHARAQELQDHHAFQFELIGQFLEKEPDLSAFEVMRHLFPRLLSAVDDMLALGETIAHLSWMRYEGLVDRSLDAAGIHRYRLSPNNPAQAIERLNISQHLNHYA
jgi:glyoxylase-like metal-dependent hydrolase (beta-lactamase superfamily II)